MKAKLVNLFTLLVAVITAFQGCIPMLPIADESIIMIISASAVYAALLFTTWKQYLSSEINSRALTPTLVVAIVASVGGLNEYFDVFSFTETASQWLRFGITFIIMGLNLVSKVMWPTPETKSLI